MRADLLEPGTMMDDRFRVEQLIGGGGFGHVYRARDLAGERWVALKVLHPELAASRTTRKRFEREAMMARRLGHPNTVRLLDFGACGDRCFIVYELLKGIPLSTELRGTTGLAGERVAHIAAQVLRALGEAHGLGLVHRDVKPANIFLTAYAGEPDFVKLLDFGVGKDLDACEATKLTQAGHAVGTPRYMAPEQFTGKAATPASDLYAVGLVMAEMVSGARVYQGSALNVIAEQLSSQPAPLPRALHDHRFGPVIVRATHKDPAARYQSAAEMSEHLERIECAAQPAPPAEAAPTAVAPLLMPAVGVPPALGPEPALAPVRAAFAPKKSSSGALAAAAMLGLLLIFGGVAVAAVALREDERVSEPKEPVKLEGGAVVPSAKPAQSAVPPQLFDAAQIRAAVEADGFRVKSERVEHDDADPLCTKTLKIDIERVADSAAGFVHVHSCRDDERARRRGKSLGQLRPWTVVVEGNAVLHVVIPNRPEAHKRIVARLAPAATTVVDAAQSDAPSAPQATPRAPQATPRAPQATPSVLPEHFGRPLRTDL